MRWHGRQAFSGCGGGELFTRVCTSQTTSEHYGSSSLLVIQVHGSKIATREEKVADWKTLINQWRNEHSLRDELSHHLVFTKSAEEPTLFTLLRS
jgi:hypothetical protein